jgi:hypothetical protein
VRSAPACNIGGTDTKGYHHLLWEIVDNAVDEVINGYATQIEVVPHKDKKVGHRHRQRARHPRRRQEGVQEVGARAGADHAARGRQVLLGQYKYSGGLHGVGSSVVNALSEEMIATVKRDGAEWEQSYERGSRQAKLTKTRGGARDRHLDLLPPDHEIFGKQDFSAETIKFRLESKTFLHKGLKITFKDEAAGTSEVLQHEGGIADFLAKIVTDRGKAPTAPNVFYFQREEGMRIEAALQWTEAHDETCAPTSTASPPPRAAPTSRASARRWSRPCAPSWRPRASSPRGSASRRGHPRGDRGGAVDLHARAAVPGADQGAPGQPRGADQVDTAVAGAGDLPAGEPHAGAAIVERIALAAKAREASRAASQAGLAQDRHLAPA